MAATLSLRASSSSIAFMTSRASVIFERKAIKIDQVWGVVATHPSGQQEHILGFEVRAAGHTSFNAIAGQLNARKVPTARGGRWTHVQVRMILERSAK